MPIGLEQWRAQIGLLYASRMPRALVASKGRKYRRMKWSSLLSFCLALVDILLKTISDAVDAGQQVSRKAISWWKAQLSSPGVFRSLPTHSKGGRKGLSLLMICLMVVQMLLIMSGDVEENPGPLTRQETRLEVSDLLMVQNELVNVTGTWYNIGLGLSFHPGKLDEIRQLRSDPSSCLQEVLDRWLKTVNPPPTWEGLAKALERAIVGEYRLAQQLRDKYCNPQQTEHDSQGASDFPRPSSETTHPLQHPASNITSVEMESLGLHTATSVHHSKEPSPDEASHVPPTHSLQHKTISVSSNGGIGAGKRRGETDSADTSASTEPSAQEELDEELHQQAFGCGCGHCSFQSFLDKGCPKPIPTTSSLVPYLNTSELDDTQKDLLKGRLYNEFEKITVAFSRLVFRTKKSLLQRKITPGQLIESVTELGAFQPTHDCQKPLLEERLDDMKKCDIIGGIFSILHEYWSFFSYRILEHIIEQLGSDEDYRNLSDYTLELQRYCKRSVFECPTYSIPRANQADLVMKVHRELTHKWTVEHVTKFQNEISRIIGVLHSTLRLCTIEKGCFQLRYQLPCSVAADIFPLSSEQEVALQAKGVLKLTCTFGKFHFVFPRELQTMEEEEREQKLQKAVVQQPHQLVSQYADSVQQASKRDTGGQSTATEGEEQAREVIEQLERQIQDLQEQLHHRDEQLQEKDITIATEQRENQSLRQQLQTTRATNQDLQQQIQSQLDQLRAKDVTTASSHRDIQRLGQELQQANQRVQEKDHVIEAKERQLPELKQQLQSNEQVTAEFQQNLLQKERMVRDLEERLATKDRDSQELRQRQSSRRTGGESIQLTWREGGKVPFTITCADMYRGAAAAEGSVAYVGLYEISEVYAYDSGKEEWSHLPECPHADFSLAVVKGLVTAVGGFDSTFKAINTLLSLIGRGEDRMWVEHFPPMPTKRSSTAVAYNEWNLIVAGGWSDYEIVSTVEVMDTENLQWYTAASLPHPLDYATATICGDRVYLLVGDDQDDSATKSVLTCSLTALLQSCQPQSLGARLRKSLTLEPMLSVWHRVADIPVYQSTCTTLRGELVAVGGHESDHKKTTAVYQYSPSTNSWQVISHMKTARSNCFVTVLSSNELMVVGGCSPPGIDVDETDVVEIATVL